MASAIEIFRSREGSGDGVFGSQNATRIMQVKTDADGDDPRKALETVATNRIRLGDPYPSASTDSATWLDSRNGIVAIGRVTGRRLSRKVWEVIVTYGAPVLFNTASTAWTVSIAGHLATEPVLFDLDNRPIGPPAYEAEVFALSIPGETRTKYHARLANGEKTALYVSEPQKDDDGLRVGDGRQYFPEPTTRTLMGGTVTLTKFLPNFPTSVSGIVRPQNIGINFNVENIASDQGPAMAIINKVNIERTGLLMDLGNGLTQFQSFAPARTLKMTGLTVDRQPGQIVGQVAPGFIWRVVVSMEFNPYTWWHEIVLTYKDEGIPPVPVLDDQGNLVKQRYRLYDHANFTSFFAGFN